MPTITERPQTASPVPQQPRERISVKTNQWPKVAKTAIPQENQPGSAEFKGAPASVREVKAPIQETKVDQAAPADTSQGSQTQATQEEAGLSPKFAELARQEKKNREAAEALRQREEQLKGKEAEWSQNLKVKAEKDPVGVLSDLGIDTLEKAKVFYERLTQALIDQPQASPYLEKITALEQKIAQLEASNESVVKGIETQTTAQYEHAISQIRSEVKALVETDENFSTIKEAGKEEDVVQKIVKTFEESGGQSLLTVDEACKLIEEDLLAQYSKIASFKKIAAKFPAQAPASEEPQTTQKLQAVRSAPASQPTITNELVAQTTDAPTKKLTLAERRLLTRERAIKRASGLAVD